MNEAIAEAVRIVDRLAQLAATNRLANEYKAAWTKDTPGPYQWQMDFHNAGADHSERALITANQIGKSRVAAAEVAVHLTGLYPLWWRGHRFTKPCEWIVGEPTNQMSRDISQRWLLGAVVAVGDKEIREVDGTGWIPRDRIGDYTFRQCGVSGVVDECKVRHVSGGWSSVSFRSYEQGAVKFQGVTRDGCWLDEEPEDAGDAWTIYSESKTRVVARGGLMIFTRTPLFGDSDIVRHFLGSRERHVWYKTVTWDDVPHLTAQAKAEALATYAEHERDCRTKGVPMLGSGAVYPVKQEEYTCAPFEIPLHWRRIAGVDFGIDHPAAAAWLAHDPDADVLYVTDAYRLAGQTAAYHAQAIMSRGKWIPVAFPHDGMIRDKGGGVPLAKQYEDRGVSMLPLSARYDDDTGGGQAREPATIEILERMRTKRFMVFSTCTDLLEEMRMLHRKDGKIVPLRDDTESALRYGVMMLRYARTIVESLGRRQESVAPYDPFEDR